MGQVYQATDTKLNRQVVLKILPEAFATDPDRLARFQREAQVLASLNHPNIAQIHGIEEADDTRALSPCRAFQMTATAWPRSADAADSGGVTNGSSAGAISSARRRAIVSDRSLNATGRDE